MQTASITLGKKLFVTFLFLDGIFGAQLNVPKKCHDVCPLVYRVVCALDILDGCFRTFASSCVMRMYNCKYQKAYRIIAERACEIITNDELQKMEL